MRMRRTRPRSRASDIKSNNPHLAGGEKDCGNIINNKHKETAQRMPSGKKSEWGDNPIIHRQDELYRIPSELINKIFTSIDVATLN